MALTATQKRILNELGTYLPGLRKGQLSSADQILLGDLLDKSQIDTIAAADGVTAVVANADATYGQAEADLINELKTNLNGVVTLVNEIKTKINAAA